MGDAICSLPSGVGAFPLRAHEEGVNMPGHRRRRREERGAAAVEFALVVPILLLVVFGIINFGFVFAQQISLNNSARQTARYAVVDGRDCTAIKNEAKDSAATIGMSAAQVPVPVITPSCSGTTKPCTGTTPGTNVKVTLTRTASWIVPFPPFTTGNAPTLEGTAVMRCEFK
jgi:Flp pilus assembly protein TadG